MRQFPERRFEEPRHGRGFFVDKETYSQSWPTPASAQVAAPSTDAANTPLPTAWLQYSSVCDERAAPSVSTEMTLEGS